MPVRTEWQRRLRALAGISFLYFVLGALVSILAKWPAHFGGPGDPTNVLTEFFSRGTALAPPPVAMLVFGGLTMLARRRDGWGTAGIIGLMALAVRLALDERRATGRQG